MDATRDFPFIENAVVEAQQSVHVIESILQSDVKALDQVVVGDKGQKVHLLGGLVRARGIVSAVTALDRRV